MRHTGNRIGGSNPSLSARTVVCYRSPSFAIIRESLGSGGFLSHLSLFTPSPPFVIIRIALVDWIVDRRRPQVAPTGRLTALKVAKGKRPGMYGDGGGLYLRVTREGAKNWVFRFMLTGRPRWMGLGPLTDYGLAEARGRALEARRLRREGIDPIEARRTERMRKRLEAAN